MNDLLLRDLEITGFRGFDSLSIEKLRRVNLIAGRNSVGKSSLLEALWIYAKRGDPREVLSVLELRDEGFGFSYDGPKDDVDQLVVAALSSLFFGRHDFRRGRVACTIGPADGEMALRLSVSQFIWGRSKVGESDIQLVLDIDDEVPGTSDLAYTVEFDHEDKRSIPIAESTFRSYRNRFELLRLPCAYANARGTDDSELSEMWDLIALTDLEEDVLRALRIVAPDIERINLIGQRRRRRSSERVPVVKLAGFDEPVPLRSLGDGLNRLFGVALALVNARNGLLLIDEIENGLHYSIQPQLWKLIFATAQRLNVQVFATTHSWDCIEAFQQASSDSDEGDAMLIRLERRGGRIVPTLFDERRLAIATREHIEVR